MIMKLLIILLLAVFYVYDVYCHDNGYTLGIRDSIMIAHSFKGGNILVSYL